MECHLPTPLSPAQKEQVSEALKNAKTIAIVGLSPDESKDSNMVAKYLQRAGYKIVPVYPKEEMILGEKVYRALGEIPFAIDIVDVFRKGDALPAIVGEALKLAGLKCIWAQIGCVNDEARETAETAGVFFVQDHCIKIEHGKLS
jgi:uncharacterized protein